jgi:hypothetical protein
MKSFQHVAAAVLAAFALLAAAPRARADRGPALGLSLDGYVAPAYDDSVTATTPGASKRQSRGLVGFATLANDGDFAAGGVVDGFPGIFGDGRLTVGGMAGWQPEVGGHRYQVLGEVGAERFSDVGGNFFNSPSVHETWLDYVGARLGTSESLGPGGHFELGAWLFVRKDIGDATVSNTTSNFLGGDSTTTQYQLGGYTAGAALRVGLRFDQRRVAGIDSTELASGP